MPRPGAGGGVESWPRPGTCVSQYALKHTPRTVRILLECIFVNKSRHKKRLIPDVFRRCTCRRNLYFTSVND